MRSLTIPGTPALEGVWVGEGSRVAIIAPPHPLMGGHLSNPVVGAIVEGLCATGYRALLFNFRGVGDSEGEASGDLADAVADYRAALAVARSIAEVAFVAGYSFGGAAAIAIAEESALSVIAVAPPPALLSRTSVRGARALCVIAGERDVIADPADLGTLLEAVPGAVFHVVPRADHFFSSGARELTELVAAVVLER